MEVDFGHEIRYTGHVKYLLPIIVERDEDDMYVVECPVLSGCYTQGETLDAALRNIQEVIELVREEPENRAILKDYRPREVSFHTVAV